MTGRSSGRVLLRPALTEPVRRRMGQVRPLEFAAWAAAVYGIGMAVYSVVDQWFGPDPLVGSAVAIVFVALMGTLFLRRPRRTPALMAAGLLVLVTDLAVPVPLRMEGSALFPFVAVLFVALYLGYLGSVRLLLLWCVPAVGWSVVTEMLVPGLAGQTLQGVVPLLAVAAATGWALGIAIRRRRAAEEELRDLESRRRRERVVLARELHDSVARDLTIITMQSAVLRSTDRAEEQEVARAAIEETARSGLDALKRLLVVLRAEDAVDGPELLRNLEAEDLEGAVQAALRHLVMLGFQVTSGPVPDSVPRSVATTAVRVVREATTNISKHAPAAAVCTMTFRTDHSDLHVVVTNDLDPGLSPRVPSTGLGIDSVAERVRLMGGTLTAGPVEGRWQLHARLPLTSPLAGSVGPAAEPARRRARSRPA